MEYITVCANRSEALDTKVQEQIENGFKPLGGLVSHQDKIVQAMIKEDSEAIMKNFMDQMNNMKKGK